MIVDYVWNQQQCEYHMKKLELAPYLTPQELYRRYRLCKDAQEARRWRILWMMSTHTPIATIIATTGMSRTWIWHICKRYNALGIAGVKRQQKQRAGAQPLLSDQQIVTLYRVLAQPPCNGGRWTSKKVAAWIQRTVDRAHVATRTGWVYLCRYRRYVQMHALHGQQVVTNQADNIIERQLR
jgi:transposase